MQITSFLETCSFLDIRTGMSYCGESVDFYREMLLHFVESGLDQQLSAAFARGRQEDYLTELRAMRSMALIVGATDLARECGEQENAVKTEAWPAVEAGHCQLLQHCHELLRAVRAALGSREIPEDGEQSCRWGADILLADQDPACCEQGRSILSRSYSVAAVTSATELLRYLERRTPRLILLDLELSDLCGGELIGRIRENPGSRGIPVVCMIGENQVEQEIRCFQAGATEFVTKPLIPEIALSRISRLLELHRLQNHLELEVDRQTRVAYARKQKLERLTHQVIRALSGTVDAKDPYTNGHSLRVAKYAREIVRRMGMGPQEQENVYYAGMLHDIGKIGIPDGIIKKTGRLTQEEYLIIKNHPIIGAEILKNVSEIPGLTEGTRCHHERYDGTGYPDGLAGEEIPLLARVIAVADAYDAMTSYRSYRDPLPQEVVRQEIAKGRGTQFDPRVTEILLEMIDEDFHYEMKQKR